LGRYRLDRFVLSLFIKVATTLNRLLAEDEHPQA
jgi:hypothetical protein